jgi:hypothetical protein
VVHVVTLADLRRAAMAAAVVSDDPEALGGLLLVLCDLNWNLAQPRQRGTVHCEVPRLLFPQSARHAEPH